jgi:signal transduction histidine kinase
MALNVSRRVPRVPIPRMPGVVLVVAGISGAAVGRELLTSQLTAGRRTELSAISVLGGLVFVLAGLLARRRQPANRVGVLMIVIGFAWLLAALRWSDGARLTVTVGVAGAWLWGAVLAHLVLAFPSGRLTGTVDRTLVLAAYAIATVGRLAWLPFADERVILADEPNFYPSACHGCAQPFLAGGSNPQLAHTLSGIENAAAAIVALAICARVLWRWRHGSDVQRRALAPVLGVSAATALVLAASTGVAALGFREVGRELAWVWDACVIALPFAFLVGVVRTRLERAVAVSQLVGYLDALTGAEELPAVLARVLGDDSLVVAYWLPAAGRYADADGREVVLPDLAADREVTRVDLDERPVAVLVHDAALLEEADVVRAAGQTAVLWLERARLEVERAARIDELRESRARIVEAGDEERRRIERDLHDGAQQRLAALLLQAKLGRRALGPTGDASEALMSQIEHGLAGVLAELRALAAGILPPVLSDHGLASAVDELVSQAPIAVEVEEMAEHRLPERVEAAAYFVIAESLTNVYKHADADRVGIRVRRLGTSVLVEIGDNGIGGATLDSGTGLRGLADRVAALDGSLTCRSPRGGGTTVRAEIPCGS